MYKRLFVVLFFVSNVCFGQKEYYCDSITSKSWKFEAYAYDGLSSYIQHNGIWYEDTTSRPPAKRLKQLMWSKSTPMDTAIKSIRCDDPVPAVLKITECEKCELTEVPAYIKRCWVRYYYHSIFEDVLTKKRYVSGNGYSGSPETPDVTYLDRDKKPLSKNTIVWLSKEIKN